jgi:hypothetical protein
MRGLSYNPAQSRMDSVGVCLKIEDFEGSGMHLSCRITLYAGQ